jgi:hypothetical protein
VPTYLGLDLAWGPRARTGLAALDPDGRLVASGSVRSDDEIAAFVHHEEDDLAPAAVKAAPLPARPTSPLRVALRRMNSFGTRHRCDCRTASRAHRVPGTA